MPVLETPETTVPAALAARLRADPTRPLVTFYDDATAERVELSVATYANWVSKTAGLAQDELDLGRGGLVLVDLPTHWLGAVWLGAAWSLGAAVTDDATLADRADLLVCGPDRIEAYVVHADRAPMVALSLRALAARFTEPLPAGVTDYGAVVLAQPDVFVAGEQPEAGDDAWRDARGRSTQADLLDEARASGLLSPGGRLLTDVNPCTGRGVVTLLSALVHDASTVWVRHPDEAAWAPRAASERATVQLRRG